MPEDVKGIARTESIEELAKLYTEANALVNPTYADSFPTVNLEALACGTPVITYRTGGSPEIVDDNTGVVVEQGDIPGLVSAIESVCGKGKEFYTTACRERAESHFERNQCFKKYLDLYEELIKAK